MGLEEEEEGWVMVGKTMRRTRNRPQSSEPRDESVARRNAWRDQQTGKLVVSAGLSRCANHLPLFPRFGVPLLSLVKSQGVLGQQHPCLVSLSLPWRHVHRSLWRSDQDQGVVGVALWVSPQDLDYVSASDCPLAM